MKVKLKSIGIIILIWGTLSFLFNLFGFWLTSVDDESRANLFYFEVRCILYQVLVFGITVMALIAITKREKSSLLYYCIFQALMLHFILFLNLTEYDGILSFWTRTTAWDYQYLEAHKPSLSFLADQLYPMTGIFTEGMFIPDKPVLFYVEWIVTTLFALSGMTWITYRIYKRWFYQAPEEFWY